MFIEPSPSNFSKDGGERKYEILEDFVKISPHAISKGEN